MTHTENEGQPSSVVTYQGASVILDKRRMVVGQPYKLRYKNIPAIAIKQSDGHVELRTYPRWLDKLLGWMIE